MLKFRYAYVQEDTFALHFNKENEILFLSSLNYIVTLNVDQILHSSVSNFLKYLHQYQSQYIVMSNKTQMMIVSCYLFELYFRTGDYFTLKQSFIDFIRFVDPFPEQIYNQIVCRYG